MDSNTEQRVKLREILDCDITQFPRMEEKLVEVANRISGPRGGVCFHPDPVILSEWIAEIMSAGLSDAGIALTQQPAEQQSKVLHSALVASLDDWQNPILTSDPRPPKNQLKPAPLSSLRVVPAEQIADGALGVTQRDRDKYKQLSIISEGDDGSISDMVDAGDFDTDPDLILFARHAQQARAQALEEAARICDGYAENAGGSQSYIQACRHNASAIRALQPHGQGGGE